VDLVPRNPLPATGGRAAEPLAEVKMFAPYAFRNVLERAITADDYAALAADNARRREERNAAVAAADPLTDICLSPFRALQAAKATLRWTGSWYEVLVAIDPKGPEDPDPALVDEITDYLEPYRRMGYDLDVRPANYVPLDLGLVVCVRPNYLRAHVESALLDVLSNRALPDGTLGFFHPDNLTFGEGIYVSEIVAAAQAVPGVQNVQVTRLERFEIGEPPPGVDMPGEEVPPDAVLRLGALEIVRLDNDPNFPENGRLNLDMRGGR
jgi:predicted phage baseplate assembly protein